MFQIKDSRFNQMSEECVRCIDDVKLNFIAFLNTSSANYCCDNTGISKGINVSQNFDLSEKMETL